jgi:hypothetical protein
MKKCFVSYLGVMNDKTECEVNILFGKNGNVLVICSEPRKQPSTSIMNAYEDIYPQVVDLVNSICVVQKECIYYVEHSPRGQGIIDYKDTYLWVRGHFPDEISWVPCNPRLLAKEIGCNSEEIEEVLTS